MRFLPVLLLPPALLPVGCGAAPAPRPELPDYTRLWDFAQPAASEARFRALLPRARAAGDPDYLAGLLTQVARAQGLQRDFAGAHATLEEVQGLLATQDLPRARVRYLLERGRTLNSSGKPQESKPVFLEAWRLARRHGFDGLAVDAAHMVAIVEKPEQSIRWNERALELARSSADEKARRWQASLLNNLGWTLHGLGEYERALASFEAAVPLREKQGNPRGVRIARWTVARCLRSLGRLQEALAVQRRLERQWAEAGETSGYVYEEIAECLHALGRREEAKPWFEKAWRTLSRDPWLTRNEADRLARLAKLAGVAQ